MKLTAKDIAINAIIAGLYAIFTLMIAPLAYGQVQFRLSEVMVLLAFYNRKFIPGLVVGCFIANIPSTLGWFDMVFGTLSTLIVCISMYYIKNKWLAALSGGIITGLIVGYELKLAFGLPFFINFLYVAIGEFVVLCIGVVIFNYLVKNSKVKEFITN